MIDDDATRRIGGVDELELRQGCGEHFAHFGAGDGRVLFPVGASAVIDLTPILLHQRAATVIILGRGPRAHRTRVAA